ncbi:MAG: MoaD/ThiS family protein [Dehalococcoidales bacterium]|nr:MoaD/ThiS family protein [Dehalococcoidales bacterium]
MKIKLVALSESSNIFGGIASEHIEDIKDGTTIRKLLGILAAKYAKFKELVFNPGTQRLTGTTSLVLNGYLLNPDEGLETPLRDCDTITFVPIIGDG